MDKHVITIESLAKELCIKLIYTSESSDGPLDNDCFSAGSTFWIGEYEDEELKLISFFHELGHRIITQEFIKKWECNTFIIELECWNLGFEEARKREVFFSDKAIAWGLQKAMSYVGHDERESSAWSDSKLWKSTLKN